MANKITFTDGKLIFVNKQLGIDTYVGSIGADNLGNIDVGSKKIINLKDPELDNDAATKIYVENKITNINNSLLSSLGNITNLVNDHVNNTSNPHHITKDTIGLGNLSNTKNNYFGLSPPTSNDDESVGFSVGSVWLDTTTNTQYVCFDSSVNASIWIKLSNANHTHASIDITDFTETVNNILSSKINIPNGIAGVDATGKLDMDLMPNELLNNVGYVIYKGTWNALNNIPIINSGSGVKGSYYVVNARGNIAIDGINNWEVGDWIIFNGSRWEKLDNTGGVRSISGKTGHLVLQSSDIIDLNSTISNNISVSDNTSHRLNFLNPHNVTKDQIGLNNVQNIKHNFNGIINPTPNDDSSLGYSIGSRWLNNATQQEYLCYDNSINNSLWKLSSASTTDDVVEGTNLYYTSERFGNDFSLKSTSDLTEGTNLYYTSARFSNDFSLKSTSDLTEGTNLYYTGERFSNDFSLKSTSDLTEGTNLYYTEERVSNNIDVINSLNHVGRIDNPHGVSKETVGLGRVTNIKNNQSSDRDPIGTDDELIGYSIGSKWYNIDGEKEYVCIDSSPNMAEWRLVLNAIDDEADYELVNGSNRVSVTKNHINREIVIDIIEPNILITNSNIISGAQIDTTKLADGSVNNVRFGFLKNVRSDIQTQIDLHLSNFSNPHQVNKVDVGLGNVNNLLDNLSATTGPNVWDDSFLGYSIGSKWIDILHRKAYICINNTINDAKWEQVSNEPGEVNYGKNIGTGAGIYQGKLDQALNFKSLLAGSKITLNNNPDNITLNAHSNPYFTLSTIRIDAINTTFDTILYFPWKASEFTGFTNGKIVIHVKIVDRSLEIRAINSLENSLLGIHSDINISGSYSFSIANPGTDGLIEIQVRKLVDGGIDPRIYGVVLKYDS